MNAKKSEGFSRRVLVGVVALMLGCMAASGLAGCSDSKTEQALMEQVDRIIFNDTNLTVSKPLINSKYASNEDYRPYGFDESNNAKPKIEGDTFSITAPINFRNDAFMEIDTYTVEGTFEKGSNGDITVDSESVTYTLQSQDSAVPCGAIQYDTANGIKSVAADESTFSNEGGKYTCTVTKVNPKGDDFVEVTGTTTIYKYTWDGTDWAFDGTEAGPEVTKFNKDLEGWYVSNFSHVKGLRMHLRELDVTTGDVTVDWDFFYDSWKSKIGGQVYNYEAGDALGSIRTTILKEGDTYFLYLDSMEGLNNEDRGYIAAIGAKLEFTSIDELTASPWKLATHPGCAVDEWGGSKTVSFDKTDCFNGKGRTSLKRVDDDKVPEFDDMMFCNVDDQTVSKSE